MFPPPPRLSSAAPMRCRRSPSWPGWSVANTVRGRRDRLDSPSSRASSSPPTSCSGTTPSRRSAPGLPRSSATPRLSSCPSPRWLLLGAAAGGPGGRVGAGRSRWRRSHLGRRRGRAVRSRPDARRGVRYRDGGRLRRLPPRPAPCQCRPPPTRRPALLRDAVRRRGLAAHRPAAGGREPGADVAVARLAAPPCPRGSR